MMNLQKHKSLALYLFFGGLNTAITFILYAILVKLEVSYLVASSVCYLVGIFEGFLFNAWFVFKHKPQLSSLTKYSLVYVVAYVINISLLYLAVKYLQLAKIEAQLLVTIIVTLLNFKLVKLLVFRG